MAKFFFYESQVIKLTLVFVETCVYLGMCEGQNLSLMVCCDGVIFSYTHTK